VSVVASSPSAKAIILATSIATLPLPMTAARRALSRSNSSPL